MSIALMTMARKTALPTNQKFALMALADWADDNGTSCWPSIYELSEYLTCSERTVQRLLRELEAGGWIVVAGNAHGGASSRRYCLNVPRMTAESHTEHERREAEKERRRRDRKAVESNPFLEGCQSVTPDRLSPVTNQDEGVTTATAGVTNQVKRGDTGVTLSTIDPPENHQRGERTQARADTPTCPDGVTEQTWADWLQLRKTKKAVVTATVLDSARREAEKAGMSLDAFLREWCLRGSQGLKADWLLADRQRSSSATTGETAYQRSMRERMQEVAPSIARKAPGASPQQASEFFEVEARRVDETRRIGGAA